MLFKAQYSLSIIRAHNLMFYLCFISLYVVSFYLFLLVVAVDSVFIQKLHQIRISMELSHNNNNDKNKWRHPVPSPTLKNE